MCVARLASMCERNANRPQTMDALDRKSAWDLTSRIQPNPDKPPLDLSASMGSLRPLGINEYRVKLPFEGNEPGQLSLKPGDIIEYDGEPEDNWQFGKNVLSGEYVASIVLFFPHPSPMLGLDGFQLGLL